MNKTNNGKKECQAFACGYEAIDDNGLFCAMHWDMIPADARAVLDNLYNEDPKSEKHRKWQREVRKCIAMMMAKEKGLKRNVERRNLDQFEGEDPFVREGERKAASEGKLLRGPDDRTVQGDEGVEEEEQGPPGSAST